MWLLTAEIRRAMERAYAAGIVPNAEQQAEFVARYGNYETGGGTRILKVAGDVAQIDVVGVLTKAPDFIAMLFGGGSVTYPEIINALAEADANPDVARAEMRIDSAGGHVSGLFDTLAAMQVFSKPLKAVVSNQAASAAYALAAQCNEIVATNRAARVGSIGIAVELENDPNAITIASTAAPKKRPDVTTPEGQAIVREELDALHELFAEAIATGRGTTVEKVNAEYGQGATLLADAAVKRGMIDAIAGAPLRVVKSAKPTSAAATGGDSEPTMDLNKLKAEHPAVYAAAVQEGQTAERDRINAHLTLGQSSGDMTTAMAAIKDGSGLTATLTATYMAAGMNRNDQSKRQTDEAAAAAALVAAGTDNPGAQGAADQSEAVVAAVEKALGIVAKAGA